jgi:hypothetical protein
MACPLAWSFWHSIACRARRCPAVLSLNISNARPLRHSIALTSLSLSCLLFVCLLICLLVRVSAQTPLDRHPRLGALLIGHLCSDPLSSDPPLIDFPGSDPPRRGPPHIGPPSSVPRLSLPRLGPPVWPPLGLDPLGFGPLILAPSDDFQQGLLCLLVFLLCSLDFLFSLSSNQDVQNSNAWHLRRSDTLALCLIPAYAAEFASPRPTSGHQFLRRPATLHSLAPNDSAISRLWHSASPGLYGGSCARSSPALHRSGLRLRQSWAGLDLGRSSRRLLSTALVVDGSDMLLCMLLCMLL